MNDPVILDIECIPGPLEVIEPMLPEPKAPANYKDSEKIAAYCDEQHRKDIEGAALKAHLGQIALIGVKFYGDHLTIGQKSEVLQLNSAWAAIQTALYINDRIIGFYHTRFDIPYMIRRSWILGVPVPQIVWGRRPGYLNDNFIDLAVLWECGRREDSISLDTLSKALGVCGKNGNGADFPALWESDQAAAIEYLKADLDAIEACAQRMLGIPASRELVEVAS